MAESLPSEASGLIYGLGFEDLNPGVQSLGIALRNDAFVPTHPQRIYNSSQEIYGNSNVNKNKRHCTGAVLG